MTVAAFEEDPCLQVGVDPVEVLRMDGWLCTPPVAARPSRRSPGPQVRGVAMQFADQQGMDPPRTCR